MSAEQLAAVLPDKDDHAVWATLLHEIVQEMLSEEWRTFAALIAGLLVKRWQEEKRRMVCDEGRYTAALIAVIADRRAAL